jgi:hypothetical protein
MPESPINTLQRWEDHGAIWRARSVNETEAIVDLCSCTGEPIHQLRQRRVVGRREPGEGERGEHEAEVARGDVVVTRVGELSAGLT